MKVALLLFLLCCSCRMPDGWSFGPHYEQQQGSFNRAFGGIDTNVYGVTITAHWYSKNEREAYRNLAALDVSKAGQLTLRDDHAPAAAPVTVVVPTTAPAPAPDEPPPPPPEPEFSWNPFKKVPETLEEFLLLAGYVALMIVFAFAAKRLGFLDRILPSKKDPQP